MVQLIALLVVALVTALAVLNWYLKPDAAWAGTMLPLPLLWGGSWLLMRWSSKARASRPDDDAVRRYATDAARLLLLAVIIVGFGLFLMLAFAAAESFGYSTDPELRTRVLWIVQGTLAVVLGNELPKILTPMSFLPGDGAARITVMRRFIGRAWVLAGLIVIVSSLVAPVDLAREIWRWMFYVGAGAMVAGILWVNLWPSRPRSGRNGHHG